MAEMDMDENPRFSTKYEDLIRQQLSHSSSKEDLGTAGEGDNPRAESSDSKRHTPIGDIATGDGSRESTDDFSVGARLVDDILRYRDSDPVQESSLLGEDTPAKAGRHTPLSRASSEAEVERQPGSRSYTPERLPQEPRFRRPSAESDKASQKSRDSQGKAPSEAESIEDIIRRYSGGSSRQTPTATGAVDDVLGGEGRPGSSGRHTPQRERLPWPDRQTPTRENFSESNHQAPGQLSRKSEVKDLVSPPPGSQTEEVPSRPESVGSADLGATGSLRGQGRPPSLTSEQELSQYFDRPHSRSTAASSRPTPTPPRAESDAPHYPTPPGSRPLSSSSLPSRPGAAQRGRATPDFQVRVPSRQTPMDPKTAERLTPSSLHSSRTVTPVIERERSPSDGELESSITNLRKLLFAREAEVEELKRQIKEQKSINKSLTTQLDQLLQDPTHLQHMDLNQRLQQLQSEKEILAAEVVKLRDALASSGRADLQSLSRIGGDAGSAEALQKQMAELQRQMEGYRSASETAASRLAVAEGRVRELRDENDRLRIHGDIHHNSVPEKEMAPRYRDPDLEIRREVRQLREDINVLKGLNPGESRSRSYRRERQERNEDLVDFSRIAETFNRPTSPLLDQRLDAKERRTNYRVESTSATEYRAVEHGSIPPLTRDNLEKHRHSRYTDDFSLDQVDMKLPSKDRTSDLAGKEPYHRPVSAEDKYDSRHTRLNAYDASLVGLREPPRRTKDEYLHNGRSSYAEHKRESSYYRSKTLAPEEFRGSHLDRSLPDGQAEVKTSSYQQTSYSSKDRSRQEMSREVRVERGDAWRTPADYGYLERSLKPDDSDELLSDTDNPGGSSLHRRSRSMDGKRSGQSWTVSSMGNPVYSGSAPLRQSTSTERITSPNPPASAGFRSITPKPLTTQHNKAWSSSSSNLLSSSLTHGMRPFAPRSPADMRLGDVVKFSRQGGLLSQGVVKFVGHLPGRSDAYVGVELDKEEGRHDGVFEDIRYFRCKPNKGVFVAFNKIVMAWAPC